MRGSTAHVLCVIDSPVARYMCQNGKNCIKKLFFSSYQLSWPTVSSSSSVYSNLTGRRRVYFLPAIYNGVQVLGKLLGRVEPNSQGQAQDKRACHACVLAHRTDPCHPGSSALLHIGSLCLLSRARACVRARSLFLVPIAFCRFAGDSTLACMRALVDDEPFWVGKQRERLRMGQREVGGKARPK